MCEGRDVLRLDAHNLETALANYDYLCVFFYDSREMEGGAATMLEEFEEAASLLGDYPIAGEMAKIDSSNPDLDEFMDQSKLVAPLSVVFRRGMMMPYDGPYEDAQAIAAFIKDDAMPSVQILTSLSDLGPNSKHSASDIVILGLFREDDLESGDLRGPWEQFMSCADGLRGQAYFYAVTDSDIISQMEDEDGLETPTIFMLDTKAYTLIPYHGDLMERPLTEWILPHILPGFGELTTLTQQGEAYVQMFFWSKLVKIIAFVEEEHVSACVEAFENLTEKFKHEALFAYVVHGRLPDVSEFFGVEEEHLPCVYGLDRDRDLKYKYTSISQNPQDVFDVEALSSWVTSVLDGTTKHAPKSEPKPANGNKGPVKKVVADTISEIVSQPGRDVLLEVYAPWCGHCKALAPTLMVLGKAVQSEERIVIAKIDGTANDVPASWGVKGYPTLLWFRASDKPYPAPDQPIPHKYWDAGTSLQEMMSFIVQHSSFDASSLKVATAEQLATLMGDEDALRVQLEEEERWANRNEGRFVYSNSVADYFLGEVIFDGKRWHVVAAAACVCLSVFMFAFASAERAKAVKASKSD